MRVTAPWPIPAVVTVVLSICAAGCSNPKYKEARQARDQSMEDYLRWYAEYDAKGPQRMEWLEELRKEWKARHERQLEESFRFIDDAYERDRKLWEKNAPQRERWLKAFLEGRPEEIEETWPKMVYR